jgi:hypothetical protein
VYAENAYRENNMTKFRLAFAILFSTILLPLGVSMVQAAVTLEAFTGSWTGSTVTLQFATGSEIDHAAFHVWRSTSNLRPEDVTTSNATRLTDEPIIGQNACQGGGGGGSYSHTDNNLGSATTYYYFLESLSCQSSSTEFLGAIGDPDSGLRLNSPNAPATATNTPQSNASPTPSNTPPANSTPTNTPNTPTRTATTAPGQPTNTPGPTGTLVPFATEVPPSATPRPTNTSAPNAPTSTTAPVQPTQANQNPTAAPVQPTQAPPPTVAPVEPTAPTDGTSGTTETTPPTETPAVIAAAVSPVVTEAIPEGEMSSNDPAATPTLAGGIASEGGIQGQPDTVVDPDLVASSSEEDGVDGLIQGLIGVILVGVVGLVGFIGWNYMRNR